MPFPTTLNNAAVSHASGQTITSADENVQSVDINALGVKVGSGASTSVPGAVLTAGLTAGTSSWIVREFNVKAYGAVGDGVTNDTAAILAAIADAAVGSPASGRTGVVFLPTGIYMVSAQILVPNVVTLRGMNGRSTMIRAIAASFPINTAVVRLGFPVGVNGSFNCRLEDVFVDCAGVAGSIAVYTNDLQEESGLLRVAMGGYMVAGFQADGTDGTTGACNFFVRDCEVGCHTDATGSVGIDLINIRAKCVVDNISIGWGPSGGGPVMQLAAVRVTGGAASDGYCFISNLHVENHTSGVLFDTHGKGSAINIEARNCTNVVTLSTVGAVQVLAPIRSGTTSFAINDTTSGETVLDTTQYTTSPNLLNGRNAYLVRDNSNSIAQRNGTAPQTYRFYNTTDAPTSNYERALVGWSSNVFIITLQNAGTGIVRDTALTASRDFYFGNITNQWRVASTGHLYAKTDNAFDIGTLAGGANAGRARNIFLSSSVVMKTKAGAPVDSDFTNPADGMECLDTTNHRHYVRSGGTWRDVAAAGGGSSSSVETDVWASGTITAGTTDDTAALNAFFAVAGNYVLQPKTYTISNSLWIKQSNTKIRLLPGAIIKAATNCNQPLLVVHSTFGSGVTISNITVEGGEWDGNSANQNAHIPTNASNAWTGHASEMSGLYGLAFWDVANVTVKDTYVHHTHNTGYQFNHTSNVTCVNARADSVGFIATRNSVDHESTNGFSVIERATTPSLNLGGYRFLGCSITNNIDVGFDLHGNNANNYVVDGCSVLGTCPGIIAPNGGWGMSFEMESADSVNGGRGVISDFLIDGVNIGICLNSNFNAFKNVDFMSVGPGLISNCTDAVSMYGSHVAMQGVVVRGCQTGITTNNINPWSGATGTATSGGASTIVNSAAPFPASPALVGYYVATTGGTGSGQVREIISHTTTTLTVSPAWATNPASGTTYGVTLNGDWTFTGCVFNIDTASANASGGAFFKAQPGVVIDGITFNGCTFTGPAFASTADPGGVAAMAGIYTTGDILNLSVNGCIVQGFNHGLEFGSPHTVQVNGGIYHHNMGSGIRVNNGNKISIDGARCHDNGINAGAGSGIAAGIELNAGANAYLTDCILGASPGIVNTTGYQAYGLHLGGGTGTIVDGGDFRGNSSSAINGATTTTAFSVRAVRGYNDTLIGTPAITVGASPYTIAAQFRDYQLRISGGTVSAVTVGGVATGIAATNSTVFVPAGAAVVITYSSAPTAVPVYQ